MNLEIELDEHVRRVKRINGAFFKPHVLDRIEDRIDCRDFDVKKAEERIRNLEGKVYYDTEYGNYQIVFDEYVAAFDLKIHDNRSGLLAYVKTALPTQETFRETSNRFKLLDTDDPVSYPGV